MKKLLVAYYSKTGNTEKIAKMISEGAKSVGGVNVELKDAQSIDAKEASEADGFAFGSPSYFSIMSGPMLSLLTELYFLKDKLASKPMTAFATGIGSQTKTVENLESIIKAYNPKLIPGLASSNEISEADLKIARTLGEELAKKIVNTDS